LGRGEHVSSEESVAHKVKIPRASHSQVKAFPSPPQEKTGSDASANGLPFFPVGEKGRDEGANQGQQFADKPAGFARWLAIRLILFAAMFTYESSWSACFKRRSSPSPPAPLPNQKNVISFQNE
jgi:hypothetical protein